MLPPATVATEGRRADPRCVERVSWLVSKTRLLVQNSPISIILEMSHQLVGCRERKNLNVQPCEQLSHTERRDLNRGPLSAVTASENFFSHTIPGTTLINFRVFKKLSEVAS